VAKTVTLSAGRNDYAPVGSNVTFTATPSGFTTTPNYNFWIGQPNGEWISSGSYAPSNTYTITNAMEGEYTIDVYVAEADQGYNWEAYTSIQFHIANETVTDVTVATDKASPQLIGTSVTFTATPVGSHNPLYSVWLKEPNDTWTNPLYGTSNNYTLNNPVAGEYWIYFYSWDDDADPGTAVGKRTIFRFVNVFNRSFTVNAVTKKAISRNIAVSAALKKVINSNYSAGSILKKNSTAGFLVNSCLLGVSQHDFNAAAVFSKTAEKSFSAAASFSMQITCEFNGNAVLRRVNDVFFNAGSMFLKTVFLSVGGNAVLNKSIEKAFNADSLLNKTVANGFSASACLWHSDRYLVDYVLNVNKHYQFGLYLSRFNSFPLNTTGELNITLNVNGGNNASIYFYDLQVSKQVDYLLNICKELSWEVSTVT
jgi:hypothetical protein